MNAKAKLYFEQCAEVTARGVSDLAPFVDPNHDPDLLAGQDMLQFLKTMMG